MKLRAPAIPLITVDPFFSIWAKDENLNFTETVHWTGTTAPIHGRVVIDGEAFAFLGYNRNQKRIPQVAMDINTLSTLYTFENEKIRLFVRFMTPLLPDRLEILSRPVSYMSVTYEKLCPAVKEVSLEIRASGSLCYDVKRKSCQPILTEEVKLGELTAIRAGLAKQTVLERSGDDVRIDWGYFYMACAGARTHLEGGWGLFGSKLGENVEETNAHKEIPTGENRTTFLCLDAPLCEKEEKLVLFAYDDVKSINYFGKALPSFWNKDGKTIGEAICEAAADYAALKEECDAFSDKMCADAYMAGGEKYSDLVCLAYRQVIAAHKVAVDENGDILFISKECFSNGCAATVDVSYPSIPMFLLYNPELVRGMMRPIYKFAAGKSWNFDFAPHDAGQFPLVTGQVYGLDRAKNEFRFESQMPVEECGNMILMEAAVAVSTGDASFAASHFGVLRGWCDYLIRYGDDPGNQLCTDDFAGHLEHNCNLSLKAITGIGAMAILAKMTGHTRLAAEYRRTAKEKAARFLANAKNADGTYRLTFDKEGSYSMKYNAVWDKLFGLKLFPKEFYEIEMKSYFDRENRYGMPLDNRSEYTKSDWLVWCATMMKDGDFKRFIEPLWRFYDETPERIPMSDWYDTVSGYHVGFIHRTVMGGIFMKMVEKSGILKFRF